MLSKIKMYEYIIKLIEESDDTNKNKEVYLYYIESKLYRMKKRKELPSIKVEHDIELDLNH